MYKSILVKAVKTVSNRKGIYALAATNGNKNALLIANRIPQTQITITIDADVFKGREVTAHLIDEDYFYTEVPSGAESGKIIMNNNSTMLIEW